MAGLSYESQRYASNLQDKNLDTGAENVEKTKDAIDKVKDSASALGEGMKIVAQNFSGAAKEAQRLQGIVNSINSATGISRRAMGGPVEAGSQYLVNDGGGREAFMNSFGRMSMLPAGRNIKWTAPTSGMVIPANLVEDFRNRLMAREQMDGYKSIQQPKQAVSRNIIKSSNTKTSTTTSSSQRIVNHVTIQSQSPVADASRLMANVSKLK